MATIIRNQILKHLSRFVKNLSADQISVEILRGRGQLHNLELNGAVLQEVLEFPPWLSIKSAVCSRVAVKVPWAKLKTVPIKILIDEVRVEVVLTAANIPKASSSGSPTLSPYGNDSYGFANKVAENMSVFVNSLEIYFVSEAFRGSLVLSRLSLASRTPGWQHATSIRHTRIADTKGSGEELMFKQVEYQALRMEACTLAESHDGYTINAPLRLITSGGKARIALKKNGKDGTTLSARLQFIFDDILWVANVPQLRSAVAFYRHIMTLIEQGRRAEDVVEKERRKAEMQLLHENPLLRNAATSANSPPASPRRQAATADAFDRFDVVETSFHVYAGNLDLHICDDSSSNDLTFPPDWELFNGAFQVTLMRLACDVYPFHLTASNRQHWVLYRDHRANRWLKKLLNHYESLFKAQIDNQLLHHFNAEWSKLLCRCVVLRAEDMLVHVVSTPDAEESTSSKHLLSTDKVSLRLPGDMPAFHVELANYFYAAEERSVANLPLPPVSVFVETNPVSLLLNLPSLRWMHYIILDISYRLGLNAQSSEEAPHSDIRIEAMMPRVIVPLREIQNKSPILTVPNVRKPSEMHLRASSVIVTNCLVSVDDQLSLKRSVSSMLSRTFFTTPLQMADVLYDVVPSTSNAFQRHIIDVLHATSTQSNSSDGVNATKAAPRRSMATDTWIVDVVQAWVDFVSDSRRHYPQPMPFLSGCNARLHVLQNPVPTGRLANINILFDVLSPVRISVDRYQYLSLIHSMEVLSAFAAKLDADMALFTHDNVSKSLVVGGSAPHVELTMVLPCDPPLSAYDVMEQMEARSLLLDQLEALEDSDRSDLDSSAREELEKHGEKPGEERSSSEVGSLRDATAPDLPHASGNDGEPMSEFPSFADFNGVAGGAESQIDETASVCTDFSDEESTFVIIDEQMPGTFDSLFTPRSTRCEEAVEAVEECDEDGKTLLSKVLQTKVTALKFSLRDVDIAVASRGTESCVLIEAPTVAAQESEGVTLNEHHAQLSARHSDAAEAPSTSTSSNSNSRVPISMKIIRNSSFPNGKLDGSFSTVALRLSNTTLANLAAFVQDDRTNAPLMPLRLRVVDTALSIMDPKLPEPVEIFMRDALIMQGIVPEHPSSKESQSDDESVDIVRLKQENADLQAKLLDAKKLIQQLAKQQYNLELN